MRSKKVSITVPLYPPFFEESAEFFHKFFLLFSETYQNPSQVFTPSNSRRSPFSGFKRKLPKFDINWKKVMRFGLPVFGVLLLGTVVWSAVSPRENSQAVQGTQVKAPEAIDSQSINREFAFSVKDQNNKVVTKFKYVVESAELQKQIIVKGQRATAVEGRVFLVVNVKVVNDFDKPLSINTRDYLRIVIDGNDQELLAATSHNDPVEAQAISTTPTRLALPIDEDSKSIELRVGEIAGKKESIKLDLSAN